MSPRTIFLSKLFGLSCILIALPMMFHKQAVVEMATGLLRDPSDMFLTGVLTLVAGLAMVLAHNIWCGGVLPVVVTVMGWAALLKGVMLLLVPGERIAAAYKGVGFERFFHAWMIVVLGLGLWVTWLAFAA